MQTRKHTPLHTIKSEATLTHLTVEPEFCASLDEGLKAKDMEVIPSIKFISFLTLDMVSKNNARYGIKLSNRNHLMFTPCLASKSWQTFLNTSELRV